MNEITSIESLRVLLGEPGPLTQFKFHSELTQQAQTFIAQSPFAMLATTDANGMPSVSPKGDGPGFAAIEDMRTLLIPERSGNRLLFSLQNVLVNPQVALIFLLPGTNETLRIAGRAKLIHDDALNKRFTSRDKPALLVMRLTIEQSYFHCAKAFLRSRLWDPSTWSDPLRVSFAKEIALNSPMASAERDTLDAGIAQRYQTDL